MNATGSVTFGGVGFGDFPGLDHIEGSCALEVSTASMGPGFAQLTWFDLHGQIGTLIGQVFGGGFDVGMGGGTWDDEEYQAGK